MDRVSGSGVFARDPDALLDLTELSLTDTLLKQQEDEEVCRICAKWIDRFGSLTELCTQDDRVTPKRMLAIARETLPERSYALMMKDIDKAKKAVQRRTAWRIEGTLREYPRFAPINAWFDYPIHRIDATGVLSDCEADSGYTARNSPYKKNFDKKRSDKERQGDRKESIEEVFNACNIDGKVMLEDLANYSGMSERTVRRHLKEHGGFWIEKGEVGLKNSDKVD
jgi:RecA-family ATPase